MRKTKVFYKWNPIIVNTKKKGFCQTLPLKHYIKNKVWILF